MSETSSNQTSKPKKEGEKAKHQPQFTVVGIGASAGGLAGLKTFFDNVPADVGGAFAFVVVMHLSPEYQSHLPELLQTHTKMPVTQVSQTTEMTPGHVYVIPPNRNLAAIDTHLRLSELEESRQQRAPIDHFFRTLARTHHEQAIGIVLSGTGADGSLGLKQIKEAGGLTVVQDPVEAEYDSMPQSAIATGLVDLVLPVADMPAQIRDFVRVEPRLPDPEAQTVLPETDENLLRKVFVQLRTHTGHDFSSYKRTTLMRRVRRRMQLQQIEDLAVYLDYLRKNQQEVQVLFRDLLITVTEFFRDAEAFAALEEKVIPRLFMGKGREDTVRVWVIGCATGEEAYSIAMLLLEYGSGLDDAPEIQVFASDISGEALARAREGYYPAGIIADVAPERLARFFQEENGGYRVKKEVREVVLFAQHNVLNDPPFSKIDLVTCRNLLIYLQREVQNKMSQLFHYALKPEGFLFLGSSESLSSAEMFQAIEKKQGLYQRRAVTSAQPHLPSLPLATHPLLPKAAGAAEIQKRTERDSFGRGSFGKVHEVMVERYAPPSLLINEDYNIVHLSQHAGRYLHQSGGEPTNSILQRIHPALRTELTTALYGAFERERPSHTRPMRVLLAGEMRRVSMGVHPATVPELTGYVLVVFLEMEDVAEDAREGEEMNVVVRELEGDLARTKERLQTAVEEFESSREEMRASNEELQSTNEELRSTAEELETSKEELQSMNEELLTLNQENKNKVEELSQLSSDLQNLLASTDVATLFLDRELRIRRFTPQVGDLFNMMEVDRGRPLSHITHKLQGDDLLGSAAQVLQHLTPVDQEMSSEDGRFYLVRLRPYRSVEDRIEGVVITFVDVTAMRHKVEELRVSNAFREHIVHTVQDGLLVLRPDLQVVFANQSFYEMFQVTEEEIVGSSIYALGNGQWDISKLRTLLKSESFADYEMIQEFEHIGKRVMRLNGRRLDGQQGILLAIRDVTEWQQALGELRQLTDTLEAEVAQRTRKIRKLTSELLVVEQKVRQRIAQVLHDDLQQVIYSMRVQLENMARSLTSDKEPELAAQMTELDEMMDTAFTMTRQMARELKPPIPVGEKLGESMHRLAAYVKELHSLKIDVIVHDDVTLADANMMQLLFHIVQELLFNVVKHAGVDDASVEVEREGDDLKVSVVDKGNGFDMAALTRDRKSSGLGLYNINEQLNLLNGRLEINSVIGDGTHVDIFIPLLEEEK